VQNNHSTAKQTHGKKTVRRLHMLDIGRMTQAHALVLILVASSSVACVLFLFLWSARETTPAAQKRVQIPPLGSSGATSGLPANPQFFSLFEHSLEEVLAGLPPISPSLNVPHMEEHFMVPMEQIKKRGSGALDIFATSGKRLLIATISETSDGQQCLSITPCGTENDHKVKVFTLKQQSFARTPFTGSISNQPLPSLEVFANSGQFHGTLSPGAGGGMLLKLPSGPEDYSMRAYGKGQLIASAGRNILVGSHPAKAEHEDSWNLKVKPGVDAVLILSCMLGTLRLATPLPAAC